MKENDNYRVYLPEAQGLLQEVSKRQQRTKKELDQIEKENEILKKQIEDQSQQHHQEITKLEEELRNEKE